MRRRFARKRRASWAWADRQSVSIGGAGASPNVTSAGYQLLPVSRVKWLCDTSKRSSLDVERILLWLRFSLKGGEGSEPLLPQTGVEFYITKAVQDLNGTVGLDTEYSPFQAPEPPGALVNWDNDNLASDGLDPFMWTHTFRLLDLPQITTPTLTVSATGEGEDLTGVLQNNTTVFYPHHSASMNPDVRHVWSPDLDLRVKRRLKKNEGLIIGFSVVGLDPYYTLTLSSAHRILCK